MSASKRAAGRRAADVVETGQDVGVVTGSAVFFALERLGERSRYWRSPMLRSNVTLSSGMSGTMMTTPKGDKLLMAASSQRDIVRPE